MSEPAVATVNAPAKVSAPCETWKPASGRIASEGMGGKRFSTTITADRPR